MNQNPEPTISICIKMSQSILYTKPRNESIRKKKAYRNWKQKKNALIAKIVSKIMQLIAFQLLNENKYLGIPKTISDKTSPQGVFPSLYSENIKK